MSLLQIFSQTTPTGDEGWGAIAKAFPQWTKSGVRVNEITALQSAAVYACVRLLAETIASLPKHVYKKLPNGDKEILFDHGLNSIITQPNEVQTSFEFTELLQGWATLRGNGYALKNVNARGQVDSLIPLPSDAVKPVFNENNNIVYETKLRNGNGFDEVTLTTEDIFHLRGFGTDILRGMNPIEAHADTIGISLAAQNYGARFFANDATPTGVVTHPNQFKDEEAITRFKKTWKRAQNGIKQHSVAVLENGLTYQNIGLTNKESQFLESRKYSVTDIARIFNIPPHMIGDLERATFSNIADQSIEFVVYTLRPWVIRWEQIIKRDLIVEDDIFVEFSMDGLLRGDTKSRFIAYGMGIRDGHLTRNEVRRLENRNAIDGLDDILVPMNMDNSTERSRDLQNSAIARIVRKEEKILKKGADKEATLKELGNHQEFISSVLSVDYGFAEMLIMDLEFMVDQEIAISDFSKKRTSQIITRLEGLCTKE